MVEVVHGARVLSKPLSASVVTLGAFDGVHRGHQELIRRAVTKARALGVEAVVYTFEPHPAKVLAPKMAPHTLTATHEQIRLIAKLGIDRIVVEPFDRTFAALPADDWVEHWLVEKLHPKHVVVGFNFSYGKDRGGDPAHLEQSGRRFGFTVEVVEPVLAGAIVCSSTRVREFVLEGNVEGARLVLDRPFALTGVVVKGEERGRTIGIPTANLAPDAEIVPAHGVYATRVYLEGDDTPRPAVTNIGVRPTFAGTTVSIESHLLDWTGDLYGKRIRVELIARIRGEKRFSGVDALVEQVRADIVEARKLLAT
jgi:riboflavin kinase / FMN adenylyltransferase